MTERLAAFQVEFQEDDLVRIVERGDQRIARTWGKGGSGRNLTRAQRRTNQICGVAGEEAALVFLRSAFPDDDVLDVADLPNPVYDLEVRRGGRSLGVEVKTTTYDRWLMHGRAVDGPQLESTTAWIYMWVALPEGDMPGEAHVVGWSPTDDVRATTSKVLFNGISTWSPKRPRIQPAPEWRQTSGGPDYGTDDPGYDDFEADQDLGDEGFEAAEIADARARYLEYRDERVAEYHAEWRPEPKSFPHGPAALAHLIENEWTEGSERRPGGGNEDVSSVQVNAEVRPLVELLSWVDAEAGHLPAVEHGQPFSD